MTEHGGPVVLEKKSSMGKKAWIGAGATFVLLAAGCWAGARMLPEGGIEPVAEPIPAVDYAAVLAEVDAALKAPVAGLKDDEKVYAAAAKKLQAASVRLKTTTAPDTVTSTHDVIASALDDLADATEAAGGEKRQCPAASPRALVLGSPAAERVRDQAKVLGRADAKYVFGTFLPAAPKEQNRRLKSGTVLKKGDSDGSGHLVMENTGDTDMTAALAKAGKAVTSVYVRAGGKATVKGVRLGKYDLYANYGADWDTKRKGFTRDCVFTRFDDKVDWAERNIEWTITIGKTGDAGASEVDPDEVPTG